VRKAALKAWNTSIKGAMQSSNNLKLERISVHFSTWTEISHFTTPFILAVVALGPICSVED
jgi:hypothetical protein